MNIHIEQNGTKTDDRFEDQIRTKVASLERYYDNIVDVIVYLHQEREIREVELKLIVKDDTLFVKESSDTFLNALEISVQSMQLRLKKYKEKTLKNI
jgi:ribosomal subunit interface protein